MRCPSFLCSFSFVLLFVLFVAACGDEDLLSEDDTNGVRCQEHGAFNPITGACEYPDDNEEQETNQNQDAGENQNQDAGDNQNQDSGENQQDPNQNNTDPVLEFCGFDMDLDFEIECSFYAHTPTMLYRIDPFRQTIEEIRPVPNGMTDVDTHPDGTLYGITFTQLFRFSPDANDWELVGTLSSSGTSNGLCINSSGDAFMTADSNLFNLDLATAQVSSVGSMGFSVRSSGDCVFNKGDRLYMSSSGGFNFNGDDLVDIDAFTANATVLGNTGFSQIYGLTAAWGYLFGTTGNSEVIRIDGNTGAAELVFHVPGELSFYGAASTPAR